MKINSVHIKNIKGISKLDLAPEKLTVFTGPSGTGKSSAMDAIRYGLTGKTPADYTMAGTFESEVTLNLEDLGTICRRTRSGKNSVRMNDKVTTAKSAVEALESTFGVSAASFGLMTSSEILEHAMGKDLAAYLLNEGFISNDVTLSRLIALCDLSEDAVREIQGMFPADPAPISLAAINDAYQTAKNSRPFLKNAINEENARSLYEGPVPQKARAALEAELANINKQLGAARAAVEQYPKLIQEMQRNQQLKQDLEQRLKGYETVFSVSQQETDTTNQNIANAQRLVTDTQRSIDAVKRDMVVLQRTLAALATNKCPISECLVCSTDKTVVRADLEAELESKKTQLSLYEENLVEYKAALQKAQDAKDDLAKRKSAYQMKVTLLAQYDKVKDAKNILPPKPDEEKVRLLQEQADELNTEIDRARKYEDAEKAKTRMNAYQAKLSATEEIVAQLAPNGGVRKQILQHSLGPLESWCNDKLKTVLPKYAMRFNADNDFAVEMVMAGGNVVSFEGISTGERMRVVLVLMGMLNALNGARVFLLDNVNALDRQTFEDVLKYLKESESEYDHAFISGIDYPGFQDAVDKCGIPLSKVVFKA